MVGLDRGAQQRDLRIGVAQREIVGGKLPLRRQARSRQIAGARLRAGLRTFDRAAQAPPYIRRPARVDAELEPVAGSRRRPQSAGPVDPAAQSHARNQTRALLAHKRSRLRIRGDCGGDVLVRNLDLADERAQVVVVEKRPPIAAIERIGRRRRIPGRAGGGRLFVDRRRVGARPLVVGADGACAEQERGGERGAARLEPGRKDREIHRVTPVLPRRSRRGSNDARRPSSGATCRGACRRPAWSAA